MITKMGVPSFVECSFEALDQSYKKLVKNVKSSAELEMSKTTLKCNKVMLKALVAYKLQMEAAMNCWNQRKQRFPTVEELEGIIHVQLKKTLIDAADKEMNEYFKQCWILPCVRKRILDNYRNMLDEIFDRRLVDFKEFNECRLELHEEKECFSFLNGRIDKLTEKLERCGENEETRKNALEQQINKLKEAQEESLKRQEQLERKLEILMMKYELKTKTIVIKTTHKFMCRTTVPIW